MKKIPNVILSALVAMDVNRVIGKQNQLPWHLPADLKHFKELTTGHIIIMGRKTHVAIGKPLPNRINVILTRDKTFNAPHCLVVNSLEEALQCSASHEPKEIFIIGGADIYRQFLPYIQRIHLTVVHHAFDGDTFFPELRADVWQEGEQEYHAADEANHYAYSFSTWERKTASTN